MDSATALLRIVDNLEPPVQYRKCNSESVIGIFVSLVLSFLSYIPLEEIPMSQSNPNDATRRYPLFERHARLLTFCGALIVFTTFIVKDNLEERWKETATAIETAQYFYAVRTDTQSSLASLREIDANTEIIRNTEESIQHPINDPTDDPDVQGKVWKQIDVIADLLSQMEGVCDSQQQDLDLIQILIPHLPDKGNENQLQTLRKRSKELEAKEDKAIPLDFGDTPKPGESVYAFRNR